MSAEASRASKSADARVATNADVKDRMLRVDIEADGLADSDDRVWEDRAARG